MHSSRALLCLLLCACSAGEADLLPAEGLPAPAPFRLTASNAVAGGSVQLTASGLPPGANVRFAVSNQGIGPGACPPVLNGGCLGVRAPANLLPSVVVADAAGNASYSYAVGNLLAGNFVTFQAAQLGNPVKLSNAVDRKVAPAGTVIDLLADRDADGFSVSAGDCADFDARIKPTQGDVVGDFHDQNCDDLDGVDADRDQVASPGSGGADCDDANPETWPGAWERCDGEDNDCDGALPASQRWFSPGGPYLSNMNSRFGLAYTVTEDLKIDRVRFRGSVNLPNWADTLRLYESTGPGQPYNLVHTFPSATMEGPQAQYNWFIHTIHWQLYAGHRYVFEIETQPGLRVNHNRAARPQVVMPWGTLTSAWMTTYTLPVSFGAPPPSNDSIMLYLMSDWEVDGDADGWLACDDCDDTNPAILGCPP